MLEFKQTDTEAVLILTLTELATLTAPNYLLVFTHVTTGDVVALVKLNTDDLSDFPQRYNEFQIDPSDLFDGYQTGEWYYKVYEQASASNTDPALSGAVLEDGKMILERDPAFSFTEYDQPQTFKAYNG